jgi:hypothetical protein
MQKRLSLIIVLSILITLFLSASITAEELYRQPRLNIEGITGDDFIGQAGVLYPFRNTEDSLWFTDFRYRMSEDEVDEWNLGLGYRKKIDTAENHIAGIYVFKDRREEYDHYWDMWTVGGEILTDKWDFRLNGYITDNDKVLAPGSAAGGSTLKVRPEDQVLVYSSGSEVYYKSMNGLDMEIGKRFTETDSIFKNVGVYAKLFRFFESDTATITGRQIRIDKQFGDRDKITWKIGAQWRDDNVRGSETEATFAVSIPFGKGEAAETAGEMSSEDILEARMTEQPERDLDVVVGESVDEESAPAEEIPVENPADGEDEIQVWYVTQDGEGEDKISLDKITNTIIPGSAEENPKEGDIIVLEGKLELDAKNYIELASYQQLISSNKDGHALVEDTINGGMVKFRPEVENAVLTHLSFEDEFSPETKAVSLSENNIVSGIKFDIKSSNATAIFSSNQYKKVDVEADTESNININNNIINFTHENPENITGIALSGYDEILIENNDLKVESEVESLNEIWTTSVGIGILSNIADDKIKINDNTLSGFYVSGNDSPSVSSSILIADYSKQYETGEGLNKDLNNVKITGNEIKDTIYGINFQLAFTGEGELEELRYRVPDQEEDRLIGFVIDNKYKDNTFEINELIIEEETINKNDREVIIFIPFT